jgi:hypothetical protein
MKPGWPKRPPVRAVAPAELGRLGCTGVAWVAVLTIVGVIFLLVFAYVRPAPGPPLFPR